MKQDNYFTIYGWMNDMHVSTYELLCYAVIYSFSKLEGHAYLGSNATLAKWMHCSEATSKRATKRLEELGYLKREVAVWKGKLATLYTAVLPSAGQAEAPEEAPNEAHSDLGCTSQYGAACTPEVSLQGNTGHPDLPIQVSLQGNTGHVDLPIQVSLQGNTGHVDPPIQVTVTHNNNNNKYIDKDLDKNKDKYLLSRNIAIARSKESVEAKLQNGTGEKNYEPVNPFSPEQTTSRQSNFSPPLTPRQTENQKLPQIQPMLPQYPSGAPMLHLSGPLPLRQHRHRQNPSNSSAQATAGDNKPQPKIIKKVAPHYSSTTGTIAKAYFPLSLFASILGTRRLQPFLLLFSSARKE